MRMRILLVSQYFWPESFLINGLALELKNRGHEVEVLTGLPNYPSGVLLKNYSLIHGPWTEDYNDITVHRSFLYPRGQGYFRLAINYISFVFGATIRALFLKNKYDVIFCFAPSPITACLPAIFLRFIKKAPLVLWLQDLWPESVSAVGSIKSQKILNMIGILVLFIYKRCDVILTQSKAFNESIIKWGGSVEKLNYIPNWAEPFSENQLSPEWIKNLPKGFKIGFAGNIGKAQDLATLLGAAEILKMHQDIKWIVAGDGSEKAWLDVEIKKRNLTEVVITVGKKPYAEMQPFFNTCDAMYVSLSKEYIFSLTVPAKLQAYMSASRPILACLDGEGARIINEANAGFCAAAEAPLELSEVILKLKAMSDEQQKQLGKNALKYFNEHFEKSKVIDQIESILKKVQSRKQ